MSVRHSQSSAQAIGDKLPGAARGLRVLQIGVAPLWHDRGDSIHMREMASALAGMGVDVTVLSLHSETPGRPTPYRQVAARAIPARFARQASWNISATWAAVAAIRRHGINIVQTRLDPGMLAGLFAARLTNRPLAVEINGLLSEDVRLYRPHNQLMLRSVRQYEKMMFRAASVVVGSSGYVEYYLSRGMFSRDRALIAPLGVNADLFAPIDRESAQCRLGLADAPTIVWTGNLSRMQGIETLVPAFARVREQRPEAQLRIVGDGLMADAVRRSVIRLGLQGSVSFIGSVPYDQVPLQIAVGDVCVATFPGQRGTPGSISALKTLSYLACGRPVVTTEMDEMGREIENRGAGLCVPPDDECSLAAALGSLLGEPESAHANRRDRARELGRERSWSGKAAKLVRCYQNLIWPPVGS